MSQTPISWIELLKEFIRRARKQKFGWSGDYISWQEARQRSKGYDADNIL